MRNLLYLFIFFFSLANAQIKMSSAEENILIEKVKKQAANTKTILSEFEQYKHLDFLENDIKTSGNLAFRSPNQVKWAYEDPYKYSVIFKNQKLFINDEGNKSDIDLGSSKLFKQLNTLIVKSIKGDMFDASEFEMEFYKNDTYSEVYFSPINAKLSKYIKAFHIIFNDKGEVMEVKMIEPSDDYTKIVFKNRMLNKKLSDEIFIN